MDADEAVASNLTEVEIATYSADAAAADPPGSPITSGRLVLSATKSGPGTARFPFSVGVAKRTSERFLLAVTGYAGSQAVIEQKARVAFVDGEVRGFGVYLAAPCYGAPCGGPDSDDWLSRTCSASSGTPVCGGVPNRDTAQVAPGKELDAGLTAPYADGPQPTVALSGTIEYRGPQPSCEYEFGQPTRVVGKVVLSLFRYDNPPPPAGRAMAAESVLAIDGDRLFGLSDCAGANVPSAARAEVTRSAAFRWPGVALHEDARDYQVRGFLDADGDVNPLFSITNVPSRGDVVGEALEDSQALVPQYRRVSLPSADDAREGFQATDVPVTLARVVRTERPAFRLGEARTMSSESTFDLPAERTELESNLDLCFRTTASCVDRAAMLDGMRAKSCAEVELLPAACDLALHALVGADVGAAYARAGLAPSFAAEDRAYFAAPVDVLTVQTGSPDAHTPDGQPDPHPLLGAIAEVPWYGPVVLMERRVLDVAAALREQAAGVPPVRLVGSVSLDGAGTRPLRQAFADVLPFAVPPIAEVDLDPSRTDCRVLYVPPGNLYDVYEATFAHCGELPTGAYAVQVVGGVAGGARFDSTLSEVGFAYRGAEDSGQSWSVPNGLANPGLVGDDAVLADQGSTGLFVVHDPHPDSTGDCEQATGFTEQVLGAGSDRRAPVNFRTLCGAAGKPPLREEGVSGVDIASCLPDACCDAVRHLCGIPLCPICSGASCPGLASKGLKVRGSPRKVSMPSGGGPGIPDCVPFAMPAQCCE